MKDQDKQNRLIQIDETLKQLYEEKQQIEQDIMRELAQKNLDKFNSWELDDSCGVILFAKNPSCGHWTIVKNLNIQDIDLEHHYIDTIESDYRESDYQYLLRVEEARIGFDQLVDLEHEFNVYIVDKSLSRFFNQSLCLLEITYKNYNEYESQVSAAAKKLIK